PIHSETLDANHIKVWWGDEPAAPVEDWLYYDDGTNEDAIGLQGGGSFYWAIKFPAASLANYGGCSVTKVAYFDYTAHSGVVRIYQGSNGNGPSTNMIGSYNYTANGTEDWVEWNITPASFDNTQDLWIVMNNTDGGYVASVGPYTGDPNGTMLSLDGAEWYTLDEATGGSISGTWNLRCFVSNQAKGGAEAVEMPLPRLNGGELAHAGMAKGGSFNLNRNRAQIVSYNVYRATEAAGDYVLIGTVTEETAPNYYEYIDSPTVAGTYYYQVTAVYDNDCESEPALAADGSGNNYVSGTTTAEGVDENGGMAIFPNPTKANVTIQAKGMQHITVVSVLGQVVYDADVDTDEVILNMAQYSAGMYTVRVMTENGVRVERVSVVR
ncbi:MAG: T9SS type A sorting domain-containing protein, partial [Bacteroidales bacterium]|nr:T9SS type A sorting domain-containing protein [Bacteroidales bacterium]